MTSRGDSKARNVAVAVLVLFAAAVAAVALVRMDLWGDKPAPPMGLVPVAAALRTWRQVARIDTPFRPPRALAAGGGKIYVAGGQAVGVYDEDGKVVGEWRLSGEPSALAVAKDGRVLVALGDRLAIHGPDGAERAQWPVGEKAYVVAVAATEGGLFLADAVGHTVRQYDESGRLIRTLDGKGSPDEIGFVIRSGYFDLAPAPDGLLRIVNPGKLRIEAWTYDGQRCFYWGKAAATVDGFAGCCNPANIAVLPDGRIVTAEKGVAPAKVKVFERDGPQTDVAKVAGVVAVAADFADAKIPLDVAVDSRGRILVLELEGPGDLRVFQRKDRP